MPELDYSQLGDVANMQGSEPMATDSGAVPSTPTEGGAPAPGGPGLDTPAEKQAVQLLMEGGMLFRKAAEVEPSVRYLIDAMLEKMMLDVTKHYGMEQEGKLALQQAKLGRDRERSGALTGPPGGAPSGAPPEAPTGPSGPPLQ